MGAYLKTYRCKACGFEFRDSERCPICAGIDKEEIIRPLPKFFLVIESLGEKIKGSEIPLLIRNDDVLNYLPDRVKLKGVLSNETAILKPSQIIPKGTLIIEEINQTEVKLILRKDKELVVKKGDLTISEGKLELKKDEKIEIEPIIVLLEVEK
jgi:hypothetical protein